MRTHRPLVLCLALGLLGIGALSPSATANHSWASYHWGRTANPFTLKLADNVTSVWDGHLVTASNDWNPSTVLDTVIVAGTNNPKTCKPRAGRVEVCNSKYGNNGWLGIAQIWASGSHITQGVVKLNDTYFNTAKYNTAAWRNLVTCQEVAHTFGLDHQDETFTNPNLGTCMDYTNDPSTNQHPNAHDFAQIESIYAHADTVTTVSASSSSAAPAEAGGNGPKEWGKPTHSGPDGKPHGYERDAGHGVTVLTYVIWA